MAVGPAPPPCTADESGWRLIERLSRLDRAPGDDGEAVAARLLAGELRRLGGRTAIEPERVHGTYWIPVGLACAAGAAAAALNRPSGALLAAVAAGSVADDLSIGLRPLRRVLPHRVAHNVSAEYGPESASATLVIHAHHDAAHTGAVFHPAGAKLAARLAGGLMDRVGGTPAPMWGATFGPAAVAIGQLVDRRALRRFGAAIGAGYALAMLDIWRSPTVPGANDNLSGVCALLAIARRLAADPPRRLRVVLLSTGSEESFLEAMVSYGKRHFERLPQSRTTFLCLESIGSPQLMLLAGEGLLRLRRYPRQLIDRLTEIAARELVPLRNPFKYRLATDGQVPLRAGYPTAVISSMDWYRAPSNYHWPSDSLENLWRGSVERGAHLALTLLRDLDDAA